MRIEKKKIKNGVYKGNLDISGLGLKDLSILKEYGIEEVTGSFYCGENNLTSLEGAPEKVGRDFYCSYNKLINLKGAPKEIGRDFYCGWNNLTSLEGAPKAVGRDFYCSYFNKKEFIEAGVKAVSKVKRKIRVY